MKSCMKRYLSLVVTLCGAFELDAATLPQYVSSSPLVSPPATAPIIDARVWVNKALFNVSTLSGLPYEAYNNSAFTNSSPLNSPMVFDPGVRFYRNVGGQRQWMDTWVNRGAISTDHQSFNSFSSFGDSRASILQVAATNIVSSGPLSSGPLGLVRLEGKRIDVSRSSLRTGLSGLPLLSGNIFPFGSPNYINDVGVNDLYWATGQGDSVADSSRRGMIVSSNGFNPSFLLPSPESSFHAVISSGFGVLRTNFVSIPSQTFSAGTNFFFNPALHSYSAVAFTNAVTPSNRVVQVIFYPTNTDSELTADARFYREFGTDSAFASVAFNIAEFDIATQSYITNSVYLLDALATTTNSFLAQNFSFGTRRPNTFQVSRSAPFEYLAGNLGNAPYSSGLLYGASNLLTVVTNRYAAYAAQVDLLSSSASGSIPYNVTNLPGRVEIIGDEVNLEETRIRSESAVIIKAKNLVGNSIAQIDSPRVNFDVRSTQPVLVVSNIAPATVKRFGGTVRAWSAVWDNYEVSNTGTNTTTNAVVTYHVLIVENNLRSDIPVTVNEFAARGTNLVFGDNLTVGQKFEAEGSSLWIQGGLSLPFGGSLGASNLIGVRHFTNDGVINLTGSAVMGTDRVLSYSNYVNRGTNIAANHEIRSRYFENSGLLVANGGSLYVDSVTANLSGSPLVTTNQVFEFLSPDFDIFGNFIGIVTNTFTNASVTQIASTLTGVSDIELRARDLVASNSYINGGTLILSVTNQLIGAGEAMTNFWNVTGGFTTTRLPATSDLSATHLRSTAPRLALVDHMWAGAELGNSPAGYTNNLALAKLTFDGGERSRFRFSGVGSSNALYIDYLELLNYATNFNSMFAINPNLTIYFANANVPPSKLDGAAGGRFRWISTYAGPLSSTNIVYPSGSNYTFNVALVQSKDLDSDGDGIVNSDDETPIYVAESAELRLALAGDPDLRALLSWNALAYSSNYLEFKASAAETNWQVLTNFHMGPLTGPVLVEDPINPTGATRVYRLRVDPGPY